ncbi:EamA family transporter [Candidatus Nomurabacteria bacterium]|nr:EamA family transporter [Candidatus Nomurabacteria bacterium]
MSWFLLLLLPPLLWSISVYLDKYLLSRFFKEKGVMLLVVISSLASLVILPFFFFFHLDFNIDLIYILILFISGALSMLGFIPYYRALEENDASLVAPFFQTITIFSYIIGYIFLGDILTHTQVIAIFIVMFAAVGLSLDFRSKATFNKKVLLLTLLSSLTLAIQSNIFRFVGLVEGNFWVNFFWESIGAGILGILIIIFSKKIRTELKKVFQSATGQMITLNILNETLNISALMIFSFAFILTPVALVQIFNGVQPFFTILIGVILTIFFPKLIKEDISKKVILPKLIFVAMMFLGLLVLYHSL